MKVKILHDCSFCFDGSKVVTFKKSESFTGVEKDVSKLVVFGAVLDPALDKKEAEAKRQKILDDRELAAKIRVEAIGARNKKVLEVLGVNQDSLKKGKRELEEAKLDLKSQKESLEKEKKKFNEEKAAFEKESKKKKKT